MAPRRFVVFWYGILFCLSPLFFFQEEAHAYQSILSVKTKETLKAIWQATPNFFASNVLFRVGESPPSPPNTATGGGVVLAGKFLFSARHVGILSGETMVMSPFGMRIMSYGEKLFEERTIQFNHYMTSDMKIVYQSEYNDTIVLELAQECRACTTPVPFGFSRDLAVGDTLVIIGNALLSGLSLRIGTMSAFHLESTSSVSMPPLDIGTADFSICPGDSGYPIYALTTNDDLVIVGHALAHTPSCRKGFFGLIDPILTDIQKETGIDLRTLHNTYIGFPSSP